MMLMWIGAEHVQHELNSSTWTEDPPLGAFAWATGCGDAARQYGIPIIQVMICMALDSQAGRQWEKPPAVVLDVYSQVYQPPGIT